MTENDERAERAFRDAFAAHGDEAAHHPVEMPTGARRRNWFVAGAAAAAVIVAAAVSTVVLDERPGDPDTTVEDGTSPPVPLADGYRWLGYRGVEVQVPEDWPFDYSPSRPDCAYTSGERWQGPDRPYVEIGNLYGMVVDIGCFQPDPPADLPEEFGVLPFDLWESHVTLADPRAESSDGSWTYQGWTLARDTVGDVQVTVLESPDDRGLAETTLASARIVDTDVNGCPITSPAQDAEFQVPAAPPVPDARWHGAIALCQYSRGVMSPAGLIGSRQVTGPAASSLVTAINDAPVGGGPDNPKDCGHDQYGETALLLRFLPAGAPEPGVTYPEAYVYSDNCFGNGIVDSSSVRTLTQGNCRPLFTEPPVTLWMAHRGAGFACIPPPE